MVETDQEIAAAGTQAMYAFIRVHGQDFAPMVYEPTGPRGECWSNAWTVATTAPDRTYVEGICLFRGKTEPHAWTVDRTGVVHEHTEGYDSAGVYVGFPIDTSPGSEAVRMHDHVHSDGSERVSVIEGCLIAGAPGWLVAKNLGQQ